MSDLTMSIEIGKLIETDLVATINNSVYPNPVTGILDDNLGMYFDLTRGELENNLLNQAAVSIISLTINSLVSTAISRINNSSFTLQTDIDLVDKITDFLGSLSGRPITVYMDHVKDHTVANSERTQKIIYQGFIQSPPTAIDVRSGTMIQLQCLTLLGQLGILSSNGSWAQSTKEYGNIFSTAFANQVNFDTFLNVIRAGTLLEDTDITEITGSSGKEIPTTLWAMILPDVSRLDVFKQMLLPYSRLVYQKENGEVVVQPLFIDDRADEGFNVDVQSNSNANWMSIAGINRASMLTNRIDVMYGVAVPFPMFGADSPVAGKNNIFASAPYISDNGKMEASPASKLSYVDVYATSARLYNSGKFIMPEQKTIMIDNSLVTNPGLLNSIGSLYDTQSLSNSIIYSSNDNKINTIPLLYAQIFMALVNIQNYNCTIMYDYLRVVDLENPLGKIVSIYNYDVLDYPDMLAISTKIRFDHNNGTTMEIAYAPLLSILGAWESIA